MTFNPDPQTTLVGYRQAAAALLEAVLEERLEPRLAIVRWPETGDVSDLSLQVAYQALWHFESDEDKQQGELFYMDAQLELLSQMARFLRAGQSLPGYMLGTYSPDTRVQYFYGRDFWHDLGQELVRTWRWFHRLWRSTVRLFLESLSKQKPLHPGR